MPSIKSRLLYMILVIGLIEYMIVPLESLYLLSSLLGLAVVIAATSWLGPLILALLTKIDPPFQTGDTITLLNTPLTGKVIATNWRYILVQTQQQTPLAIPHQRYLTEGIENKSQRQYESFRCLIEIRPMKKETLVPLIKQLNQVINQTASDLQLINPWAGLVTLTPKHWQLAFYATLPRGQSTHTLRLLIAEQLYLLVPTDVITLLDHDRPLEEIGRRLIFLRSFKSA